MCNEKGRKRWTPLASPSGSDGKKKKLPAMQETQVQSLDRENSLEKGMATHSSILPWRIPWRQESDGWVRKESDPRT